MNIGLADILNTCCDTDEAFQLVVQDGTLYIKTANDVITGTTVTSSARLVNDNTIVNAIDEAAENLQVLSVKSQLSGIVTTPVISRSSKVLSVPYVPQEGNTCWAAAGAALGRYHTGSQYAHYTASDLAEEMGVDINSGASMNTTREMLSSIFHINTTYYENRLANDTAINLFQQAKPILAGFYGSYTTYPYSQVGHMVVLCGFSDGGNGAQITYYVRDSNYESMMTVISYSNESLAMDYYNGIVMYWVESAHYLQAA